MSEGRRALPVLTDERGPRERALDESERAAARALDDDARLAERWRLERRFSLERADLGRVVVDEGAARVPLCDRCTTPCCARPEGVVSLRLRDVARLVDRGLAHAAVPPRTLLARFPAIARALGPLVERESFTRALVLDKRDDGTCVFFDGARCTIHEVKPLVCRAFPHQLDDTRARVRYASSCESARPASDDEVRAGVRAAVASYDAKVQDVVTRAFAADDVVDLTPP